MRIIKESDSEVLSEDNYMTRAVFLKARKRMRGTAFRAYNERIPQERR